MTMSSIPHGLADVLNYTTYWEYQYRQISRELSARGKAERAVYYDGEADSMAKLSVI